jgi:hypothetical protein
VGVFSETKKKEYIRSENHEENKPKNDAQNN